MTRREYLAREERRRTILSWGLAAAFYGLAFALVLIVGMGRSDSPERLPSPVWIELEEAATAEAEPGPSAPAPELAGPAETPPSAPPAPLAPQAPPAPKPANPTAPVSRPRSSPLPPPPVSATEAPLPLASPRAEATSELPAEPWIPGPRPAGSRITATSSTAPPSAAPSAGLGTTITGSEQGNSLQTVLGAQAGKAGRNLYVPIYLFMPLPSRIDGAVAARIPSEQRDSFLAAYRPEEGGYILPPRDVPFAERGRIWIVLEKAGYDLSRAEYKAEGRLKSVVLSFVVTPKASGKSPRLEAVEIVESSGDRAVDAAVLYGFSQADFFNATDGAVSGTFTYRFN